MVRRNLTFLTLCGAAAAFAAGANVSTAHAGWHWHGSWGGYGSFGSSYGSYGSGGSNGSHGSHGGWRLGARLHAHHHGSWGGSWGTYRSYASWGSSGGSNGSSGGSSGGYSKYYYGGSSGGGSSGGGSSGGSYGSSGGGATYAPAAPAGAPMPSVQPPPPPAADAPAQLPAAKAGEGNQALLKVSVPEDALVYVNGMLTKSTGSERSYRSRGLNRGFQYSYEVRAEAIRNGQKVEETKVIQLVAGETVELAFQNLQPGQTAETTLTLNVPANAKVSLGGNPTQGEGSVRVFKTTRLAPNQEWSSYVVEVSIERDGQTLTQEKTVSLKAGDSKTLSFDFDATQFAANR